jgi:glycosyltransferase involved in cell wall biosynthesis
MSFDPANTTFVILSFEGPDQYSLAGGLGVRVKELSRALAQLGHQTHLYFVGDPDLPAEEGLEEGRLVHHRWSQWLSAHHRTGVYEAEDDKVRDWNHSLPPRLIDDVIAPALAQGDERRVIVMGEEWHAAHSMNLISDSLHYRGLRSRVVMLWNANNLFSFHRINWSALGFATTLTTVSRYMKHAMWLVGVNPIVIPNGIPKAAIREAPESESRALREAAGGDLFCFKIGRFDPDKRWLMAIAAAAQLKREGVRLRLLIRGGREPHGGEVLAEAYRQGLEVVHSGSPVDLAGLAEILRQNPQADLINLTTFLSEEVVAGIYAAADAVLANSGHEPFGLVGLEVMAAGGLAVTGSTGEDYAEPYRNALVLETDLAAELVTMLRLIRERPALAAQIRRHGQQTAAEYTWDRVIEQLSFRLELAAGQQGVAIPAGQPPAGSSGPDRQPEPAAAPGRPGPRAV